ncbi:succinate dehydrogenase iron-sulfur subunit [Myxococcota bacterium]|nr:succinate dehydrogenase iron-sulfur subunit [Myxococcota bacterium]
MEVSFEILRFDPSRDSSPRYQTYRVEAEPNSRILDVLNTIKWEQDGTLTYRRSCAHGVCGSDAVVINGKNGLACQQLLKNYGGRTRFRIEPLPAFRVIKDLVVDMEPFFRHYERIKPYFVNEKPPPETERLQDPVDREAIDDATKCILCGACTGSCPSFWSNQQYLGPAALLKAFRFVFDTRDTATDERLKVVNDQDGLWRCHTIFNCNACCPKEIDITDAISRLKVLAVQTRL